MQLENTIQIWLTSAMMGLGMLVFLLGLWILFLPAGFLNAGRVLGKWVSTDQYFGALDKPLYQEGLIYRHHRIIGGLITIGALYTLVILTMHADFSALAVILLPVINSFWSEWFYGALYLLMVIANLLAVIIGIIVFIRPSILKGIESTLNRWIAPEQQLKQLDEPHEISIDVFPGGKPRLFGLAVALGGIYIMLSMAVMLL